MLLELLLLQLLELLLFKELLLSELIILLSVLVHFDDGESREFLAQHEGLCEFGLEIFDVSSVLFLCLEATGENSVELEGVLLSDLVQESVEFIISDGEGLSVVENARDILESSSFEDG